MGPPHGGDHHLVVGYVIGLASTSVAATVSEAVSQPGNRHFRFNRNGVVEQDEHLLFHQYPRESLKEYQTILSTAMVLFAVISGIKNRSDVVALCMLCTFHYE